jgi:peptidyl-tRNA hydrolase, PTH1 family
LRLIVGLGNPGARYEGTRHNIGFAVLDEVAARHEVTFRAAPAEAVTARLGSLDTWLAKPTTFMNLSGRAVGGLCRYFRVDPEDLLIVSDDVNLPVGRLRARARGSAGGHNGLRSIIEALGTEGFPRLRLGVGRGDGRRDLADHVLARFGPDEQSAVESAVRRGADAIEMFIGSGVEAVMNTFNRPEEVADTES